MRKTLELNDYRTEDMPKDLEEYRYLLKYQFNNDRHRGKMGLRKFLEIQGGRDWEVQVICY